MVDFSHLNRAVLGTFRDRQTVTVDGVTVEAIYDSRHYAIDDGEAGGSTLITSIAVRRSVANTILVGTTPIIARGIGYRATDKQPDGEGLVVVTLERSP